MGRSGSIDHRAFRRLITGTDSVDKSFSLRPSFFFIRISHRGDAVFSSFFLLFFEKKKKRNKEIKVLQTNILLLRYFEFVEFLNAYEEV